MLHFSSVWGLAANTSCDRLTLQLLLHTWPTAHSRIIISTTSIWYADSWEVAIKKLWLWSNTIEIIDDGPVTRVLSKMRIKKGSGSCSKIEYGTKILRGSIHWNTRIYLAKGTGKGTRNVIYLATEMALCCASPHIKGSESKWSFMSIPCKNVLMNLLNMITVLI